MEEIREVIEVIKEKMKNSYSVYSGFAVGAAVLGDNNSWHYGVNVENISYGLTICAERNAVSTAITEGVKKILKVIIVADTEKPITPCGACREFMYEFADENSLIYMANLKGDIISEEIYSLLPMKFKF
jgi:cytidine deaminase